MNTRRITTSVGITAGGALAAAFFSAVAAADPADVSVGGGSFTIDGLTYTPEGSHILSTGTFSYPPYADSEVQQQLWNITDASGYKLFDAGVYGGGGYNPVIPSTTVTDWFGTTTTQFSIADSAALEPNEIASALSATGLSNLNFSGASLPTIGQYLLSQNVDLGTITGAQLTSDLPFPTSDVTAADLAGALGPYAFYNNGAYGSVLTAAGITDSDFTHSTDLGNLTQWLTYQPTLPGDIASGNLTAITADVNNALSGVGITLPTGTGAITAADIAADLKAGSFVDASTVSSVLSGLGLTDSSFAGGKLSDVVTALTTGTNALTPTEITSGVTGAEMTAALGSIGFTDFSSGTTTVADSIAATLNGVDLSNIPTDGTTYAVTNLGNLFGEWYNVYSVVPGLAGADPTITDTLVTPWGNFDESWLVGLTGWDPLMDASGVLGGDTAATTAAATTDWFSDLFGNL